MFNKVPGIIILVILVIGLLALLRAAAVGIDVTVTPGAAATPSPEPTPSPTPTPASTPAAGGTQTTDDTSLENALVATLGFLTRFSNMLQAFLPGLLGLLVVALVSYTIWETNRYRIELDKLQNGTCDETFDGALAGMEPLVREKLVSSIEILLNSIKNYSGQTSEGAPFPEQQALPQDANLIGGLDKVVESFGEDAPKYVKPFLSLWRYLFPGRGTRIRMTLQHDGNPASPLGITIEFIDLGDQKTTKIFTVGEEKLPEDEVPSWVLCTPVKTEKKTNVAEEGETSLEQKDEVPWAQHVAQALERAHLDEDALTYYEKALAENKEDETILAALVKCQNRLAERAGPAAAFAAAARLEERKLLEAATESYARVFPNAPQVSLALLRWKTALGLTNGPKGPALNELAGLYSKELKLHAQAFELYKRAAQEGSAPALAHLKELQKKQADALAQAGGYLLENAQWAAAETYLGKAIANVPDHPDALQQQIQLKATRPAQENKEALAAFELGNVYKGRGRQAAAIGHFEKALEKQPDYTEAQEALDAALERSPSLRGRFTELLQNAMDWLAVELIRQKTDRHFIGLQTDEFRKAQYHNFYGAHLFSLDVSFPSAACLAERELMEAIRCAPDWVLPYISLGDLFAAQALREPEREPARRQLRKAIAAYETALTRKVRRPDDWPQRLTKTLIFQIHVSCFAAELLTCPEEPHPGLWRKVQGAEEHIRGGKEELKDIPLRREFEDLYAGLGALYGLVDYRYQKSGDDSGFAHPKKARARALFYIACGGCIEKARIWEAQYNPILVQVFEQGELDDLFTQVEIIRFQHEASPRDMRGEISSQDALSAMEEIGFEYPENFLEEA